MVYVVMLSVNPQKAVSYFLVLFAVSGCAGMSGHPATRPAGLPPLSVEKMEEVKVGDTSDVVIDLFGPPNVVERSPDRLCTILQSQAVWIYFIDNGSATEHLCVGMRHGTVAEIYIVDFSGTRDPQFDTRWSPRAYLRYRKICEKLFSRENRHAPSTQRVP